MFPYIIQCFIKCNNKGLLQMFPYIIQYFIKYNNKYLVWCPPHAPTVGGEFKNFCKCTDYLTITGFTCTKPLQNKLLIIILHCV